MAHQAFFERLLVADRDAVDRDQTVAGTEADFRRRGAAAHALDDPFAGLGANLEAEPDKPAADLVRAVGRDLERETPSFALALAEEGQTASGGYDESKAPTSAGSRSRC